MCHVPEETSRTWYQSGTADLKKTKAWKRYQKNIAQPINYDKMEKIKTGRNKEVHKVGKIDRDVYKCVTENIVTDEVIITDERIKHIKERHPNDFERYCGALKEIVEDPQYIIETNKPYTALILKEFMQGNERFKTVLRLTTSHDNPEFKNSIITFMKINEKEWDRLLRNKVILYRKE